MEREYRSSCVCEWLALVSYCLRRDVIRPVIIVSYNTSLYQKMQTFILCL